MGESFGPWTMGRDAELMEIVTSINVACGFHAGDPTVLRTTVETAIGKGVAIGAHPSFPDLQGFGRREMRLTDREVFDLVLYQVSAVRGICEALGTRLRHVKPHGALYNQAARERTVARAIAEAVRAVDPALVFFGLSGSHLIGEAEAIGLRAASEVFADRTYRPDGSLTPRSEPCALIDDETAAVEQVLGMAGSGTVRATDGSEVRIKADTVCVHGDGPHAFRFASLIRAALYEDGITIKAVG